MPATVRWQALLPLAALVLGVSAPPAFGQGEADSLSASFRKAARRVLPAVVTVRPRGWSNPLFAPFPGGPPRRFGPEVLPPEAGGSGVVIDAGKGLVLTNDHVIQGTSQVVVVLHDGRERSVSQVRRDPKSDLALLVIDAKGLSQADWGDSDALDTGDWVLAIGQPFGLSDTVTAGIVSGKGRGIGVAMYEDLIQTDAAINPGNSGGPLINLKGEIVGINTAIKTLAGGYDGVGFAIQAKRARRVAADLAEHGRVRRSYLGVQVSPAEREEGEPARGLVVTGVTAGSPAADAGLRRGDVITELDGKPIDGPASLQAAVELAPVDRPLTLSIEREGAAAAEPPERLKIEITPKPQPDNFGLLDEEPERLPGRGPRRFRVRPRAEPELERAPEPAPPRREPAEAPRETSGRTTDVPFPALGLRLSEPTAELTGRYRLGRSVSGLVVAAVDPDGPADQGGIEPGMVVTDAAGRKVDSLDDFRAALKRLPDDRDLVIRVLKGTKAEFRVIPRSAESRRKPSADSERGGRRDREP
jgi:serine protease Do